MIFLCLLSFLAASAETLPFKNYTTADNLAHDRVNKIVRDTRGFLWFCTGEGLSRFDGYEFKNYTQRHGLPHRSVNDLAELPDGKYLVATNDGLAIFDPAGTAPEKGLRPADETPMFRAFRPPDNDANRKASSVEDLLVTRSGQIWAATLGGLYRLAPGMDGGWQFDRFEHDAFSGKVFEFLRLLEDRRGGVWVGGAGGLFRVEPGGAATVQFLKDYGVVSLLEDRQGRVWVGGGSGTNSGLRVFGFSPGGNQPALAASFTTKDGLTVNDWLNASLESADGRVLIGAADALLEFLPSAGEGELRFRKLFEADIVSLAEDGEGNIWLGTATRGAFKIARRGFVLFGEKDGIPPATVNAIFSSGGEVFATSAGLDLLRFDGGKFVPIRPFGMKPRSWGWNQLDFRARNGEWWIPTGSGLMRYPAVNRFEDLARTPPLRTYTMRDGLWSDAVFRAFEDSRGDVWFSMLGNIGDTGNSMARWEHATDTIRAFKTEEGFPYGNGATAFGEDRAGNVWIGFYYGGVGRFRDGRFRYFSPQDGFPTGLVNAVHTDRGGRLWVATSNSGVLRYDDPAATEPQFVNLTVAEGLSSNQATCLTEDNFGRIYVGTGRGVTRIEPETGRIKTYTQADGLPGSYVRTCGRDSDGNLWFSQQQKLARLTPEAAEESEPPPIFIEALSANGVRIGRISELGEVAVADLNLEPEQRQIQIDFFALGFGAGETLRYQYKLYGTEKDWSPPDPTRSVSLNLAPGAYRFLVRAVNSEGVTSAAPASISFTIARPVWQRWWFLLLAVAAFSLVIYAIYRYRVRRLLELERVRTRIATDLHDDIGSSLSQIAILSEVVRQKIQSENGAGEPLKIIAGTSREMVDSMSDIVWAINPHKDRLSDLVQRMRRFASDTLEGCDIVYHFAAPEKSGELQLGADQRREIYLIFKECVNNLVKHSRASRAIIEVKVENNFLTVKVADDGRGFDAAQAAESADGYGGNGLPSMKKRAELLGGSFIVKSKKGRGAKVVLRVPVGNRWEKLIVAVRSRF